MFVVVLFPPPQSNVALGVEDAAVSTTLLFIQFKSGCGAMLMFGTLPLAVTIALAVAVQPLPGSVTVTLYVPGVVTTLVELVPPPLHAYVTPGVDEDAVSVTLVTVQDNAAGGVIEAVGGPELWLTVVDADTVQPVDGSVATTV